ncbi:MAG TPA: inositol monophosphatase family protein [Chloroflexia bacterium]|nr:inositol monophosphatase family protein [Chloroflexia bacterium]
MEYAALLPIAIAAAQEAGALLRAELWQPGGPAGAGEHAEADERAEWVIRARLLAATPGWGYLGEETGRVTPPAPAAHTWLVDPNDGTVTYLRGFRGSAVSIGLVRAGVPILGVVYAFAAPDNAGDLFAWAEGCGPLQRNGVPVDRAPWATTLTPQTVVLLSQAADRVPAANLACVAPGRYQAGPSIAYRLALAAAGDGEVAVSLQHPGSWDYAGGHALVRGSGGALVDETGAPVTYTPDGTSITQACFGGAPALLPVLAAQPWDRVLRAGQAPTAASVLCRPLPGHAIADDGPLRRAQGCLLGQLTGDALGSMVEFQAVAAIRRRYPQGLRAIGPSPVFDTLAGQPTDDSELALALARTLLRTGFDAEAVAAAYGDWLASGPFDVGGTIRQACGAILQAHAQGRPRAPAALAAASRSSEANGALMRQSPLAIWGAYRDAAALDHAARTDTRLTHPHPVCQDASAAFLVALAAVIREGLDPEGAYARAVAWDAQHGRSPAVTAALAAARQAPPAYEVSKGHVLIALQNAFYQALHAPTVEAGVVATVMAGGDTDTNAAIAGALLGAIHGAPTIPPQWRQAVLTCRPAAGAPGVRQPRPPAYWPADALILAERLLDFGLGIGDFGLGDG